MSSSNGSEVPGTCTVAVKVPDPEQMDVLITASGGQDATFARLLQPARGRFVLARAHAMVKRAGVIHLNATPNAKGRVLIAEPRYRVTLHLWINDT